jgi:hypothetical protein
MQIIPDYYLCHKFNWTSLTKTYHSYNFGYSLTTVTDSLHERCTRFSARNSEVICQDWLYFSGCYYCKSHKNSCNSYKIPSYVSLCIAKLKYAFHVEIFTWGICFGITNGWFMGSALTRIIRLGKSLYYFITPVSLSVCLSVPSHRVTRIQMDGF